MGISSFSSYSALKKGPKILFSIGKACSQKHLCQINVKRFRTVTHNDAASFSIKTYYYETNNIFYLNHQRYLHKTVKIFWKFSEIKVTSRQTFFITFLKSALIFQITFPFQRLLDGNKIAQYFKNYKCYGVKGDDFRRFLYKVSIPFQNVLIK